MVIGHSKVGARAPFPWSWTTLHVGYDVVAQQSRFESHMKLFRFR